MTRILIVEDEDSFSDALSFMLRREGYEVFIAADGNSAIIEFDKHGPDLVLLDLMLPGISGTEVCRIIRGKSSVPIIMLTAKDGEVDKVVGLELGADDYVTKPFVAKELMARIRTQLRRVTQEDDATESLVCGPIELRMDTAEVVRNGEVIPVSRIEFYVLAELIGAQGRVLSRDHLLRKVWGYGNAGDGRVVDNLIYRLRNKIEDDSANPELLLTVRGFGYRMKA